MIFFCSRRWGIQTQREIILTTQEDAFLEKVNSIVKREKVEENKRLRSWVLKGDVGHISGRHGFRARIIFSVFDHYL